MNLHQEDIDTIQAISILAAKFGFTITKSGTRQNNEIGQLEYTGPDENKAEFARAVNELLIEKEKAV